MTWASLVSTLYVLGISLLLINVCIRRSLCCCLSCTSSLIIFSEAVLSLAAYRKFHRALLLGESGFSVSVDIALTDSELPLQIASTTCRMSSQVSLSSPCRPWVDHKLRIFHCIIILLFSVLSSGLLGIMVLPDLAESGYLLYSILERSFIVAEISFMS